MKTSSGPTTATMTVAVSGENEAEMLEGLEKPHASNVDVGEDDDGTIRVQMDIAAVDISLEPRTREDTPMDITDEDRLPVYEADVDWGIGRVDTSEWDITTDTAERVYDSLIEKVSRATKVGTPSVVVVGRPQYKALWVYVSEIHSEAENPEQLVPLKLIVVPGPQLHVDTRNLDVLYDSYDK